jgi:RNA polymerase sigma-70 factor (ECF subfamily)
MLAAHRSSAESEQAMSSLCHAYYLPIYAYARRRLGDPEQAQDVTQTFFAVLLEKNYLKTVDRSKGRFRAFLLTALKRLMANEWDMQTALKRGGGKTGVSIDFGRSEKMFGDERSAALTAEQHFDRAWVRTLLEYVLEQLRVEFETAGKADQFDGLREFITPGGDPAAMTEVAARLELSESTARVAVHRLRKRFRQELREQVAQTVADPAEIEDEIRELFAAFE